MGTKLDPKSIKLYFKKKKIEILQKARGLITDCLNNFANMNSY